MNILIHISVLVSFQCDSCSSTKIEFDSYGFEAVILNEVDSLDHSVVIFENNIFFTKNPSHRFNVKKSQIYRNEARIVSYINKSVKNPSLAKKIIRKYSRQYTGVITQGGDKYLIIIFFNKKINKFLKKINYDINRNILVMNGDFFYENTFIITLKVKK